MRILLKLFALPVALLLMAAVVLCSFVVAISEKLFSVASALAFLLALALLISHQTAGGIAWLAVAVVISPYGIPALANMLVSKMGQAGYALKYFILG